MSQKVTAQEGPYISLEEAVAAALDGKEDQLLSINNAGKAVLFDGTAPALAVMVSKLQPGSTVVNARLLGKGGTVRVIQDEAIALGAPVSGKTGTARVETADVTGPNRILGYKIGPSSGAQGDVIEIVDLVEIGRVATAFAALDALTSTNGVAAAASADLAALAAETEKVGDDVRALHAKVATLRTALIAQGILS